ncbi:hypothetical protein FB567DRAFT_504656 [Paraphoma chrysanthemicola]|uniref:F5/8 type C domain-containing protein n=1 Tax=Paraphoma chrysanthemicola TaxID=798071 RepID=A0A8K0QWX1_9PLEO|nr:hypothetical protein FB567DRAFT_504656 [Paraphoma chrysanthemicola]
MTRSFASFLFLRLVNAVSITVSDFQPGNPGTNAIDQNNNTLWHSQYEPAIALPHRATLDLGIATWFNGFTYLPRQDVKPGNDIFGNIGRHDIEISVDNNRWTTVVSQTTFTDTAALKTERFTAVQARYIRITAFTEAGNRGPWTSAAELGVLLIENPPPNVGSWSSVISLPLVAAGAFLIPESGKLLLFSASGLTDFESAKGNTQTATYDPTTGAVSQRNVRETGHDMFCPGLSLDFDGRAIVTGGNDNFPTSIYTPSTNIWSRAADMQIKRGYQSSTTLSNGQVFQIGGSWVPIEQRGGKNAEIYNPSTNTWTLLPDCPVAPMLTNDAQGVFRSDNHGWLFGWKNAWVFQAGPSKAMGWYGTTNGGSYIDAGRRAADGDSMCGTAVMYDAVQGKIFSAGGSPSYEESEATNNAHVITIGEPESTPSVAKIASMAYKRVFHNSVVLPDGKIFTTGGQTWARPFSDATAVMQPEMWNPETQQFIVLPSHRIPRTYHSIAILLLDGTVFTAGGGLCGGCATNHLDAEIFSPGYLFNSNGTSARRPVINSTSRSSVAVGASLIVETDMSITKFSLIRYGSVTHTVNTDQRRIPLDAVSSSGTTYTLNIPGDPGIALPGYWMLFALNSAGVPSVAKTIKVTL